MGLRQGFLATRARLRRMRADDPLLFRVRAVLAAVLGLLLLRLAFGDDPWTGGIAERLRAGDPVRPVDYARTWCWWAAAGIAPVVALGLASARRWLVRDTPPEVARLAPPGRRPGGVWIAGLAAALLAAGWLGLPRLSQGLFEDERYNVMWSIDGFYLPPDRSSGDALRFYEPRWADTLWHYEWPNNHVPHTILARLSVSAWRALARPESRLVNEAALRMPAFLAGLASVAAVAAALWRLGHPGAGLVAAWVLALHPWHLRYATEARGYSLVLLGISASVFLLAALLHRGRWRRWGVFGVLQLLLLWTYPAALFFVLVLNGVTLGSLVALHRGTPALGPQLVRWAVVGLAGALVWAYLMAPNLAQFAEYVEEPTSDEMDVLWYQDVGAFLLAGTSWGRPRANDYYTELSDLAVAAPAEVWGAAALAAALVALGALRWLVAGGLHRRLLGLLLLPPLLLLGWGAWSDASFHPHYMLLALPPLAMLLALGVEGALRPLGRGPGAAVAVALGVAFAAFTQAPRSELRTRAIQPWRDSVALTRPVLDPAAPANEEVLTASYSFPPQYYDPRVVRITRAAHLRALMAQADASGRRLFVNLGRPGMAQRRHPDLAAMVLGERFEEVALLPGILSRGQRQVFRYRGAGAYAGPPRASADR